MKLVVFTSMAALVLMSSGRSVLAAGDPTVQAGPAGDGFSERLVRSVVSASPGEKVKRVKAAMTALRFAANARVAGQPGHSRLDPLVTAVERGEGEDAVARIGQSLPVPAGMPQLTDLKPLFFSPSPRNYPIAFTFSGTFVGVDLARRPFILVGEKRYEGELKGPQTLVVTVPVEDLMGSAPAEWNIAPYQLAVPLAGNGAEARFPLVIGRLPDGPGKVTLLHREVASATEMKHLKSKKWSQRASKKDRKGDYCAEQMPGWRVIPESVTFIPLASRGNQNEEWSSTLVSINPRLCYRVETLYNRHGVSGSVDFRFEYDVQRTTDRDEWQQETVDVRWGDSRSYPYPEGEWKVVFEAFDGSRTEFSEAGATPLIRVSSGGGFLTLTAPSPQKLEWP